MGLTKPTGHTGNGTYDLIIDECEDGWFNPGVDVVVATITVSGTSAVGIKLNPRITVFKANATAQYQQALLTRQRTLSFKNGLKYISYASALAHVLLNAGEWLAGTAVNLGWSVDFSYGLGQSGAKRAVFDQIDLAQTAVVDHWAAIKNDPPDPNYTSDVTLGEIAYLQLDSNDQLNASTTRLGNATSQQAAALEALLHALERFQGAANADNKLCAIKQARAARRYANLIAVLGTQVTEAGRWAKNAFAVIPEDYSACASRMLEMQGRTHPDGTGFSAAELALFQGVRLDPAKYPQVAQELLAQTCSADPLADL